MHRALSPLLRKDLSHDIQVLSLSRSLARSLSPLLRKDLSRDMQVLLALLASMSIFFLIFPLFVFYFLFVGIKGWHDTRRVFFNAPPPFFCVLAA